MQTLHKIINGDSRQMNELKDKSVHLIVTSPVLYLENNYFHSVFEANKGLCGMFRNPEAHEPKISWNVSEQDALEILGMISYCHRRLDKAQKNKKLNITII